MTISLERQRLVAKYARHFGATLVEHDRFGTLKPVDLSELEAEEEQAEIQQIVGTVRQCLAGASGMHVTCRSERVKTAVELQLTAVELSHVILNVRR